MGSHANDVDDHDTADPNATVDLPSDAFDALSTAVDALDDGESIQFDSLLVERAGDAVVIEVAASEVVTPETTDGDVATVATTDGDVEADSTGIRFETRSDSELHAAAETAADAVTNWYFFERVVGDHDPRRAFLRWLEHGDSKPVAARYERLRTGEDTREWGELRVTVRITDRGERRYDVRNGADAGVDIADLEPYEDPLDACRLVTFDDDGRYRPLKAAPSLPTGWVFSALGPRDVYELVETVYPATVVNWHREREGRLDIDHWQETMARQSGIYGVIKTWDRGAGHEHVNRVAAACCDDSQCLKRREWQYDSETDLDVDGGDGVFPCREPCSLVVSAARKWTQLEGESSQTYEFELTPSEKAQIEDIIDAVADGRTHEIREADIYDGANRYRARYLRAKLFDEDGQFAGVATDPTDAEE